MALGRADRRFAGAGACCVVVLLVLLVSEMAFGAEGDFVESFGPDGTTTSEFGRPAALAVDQETGAVYVGDSEAQVLYKFDADGNPLNYGGTAGYLSENKITGLAFDLGGGGTNEAAVDSESHVVYVTSGNKVKAFEANGEPHEFTAGPGIGTNEIPGAADLSGVAVDAAGSIYASDTGDRVIRIYLKSGALITQMEPGGFSPPSAVAVAPDGTLYSMEREFPVYAFEPSEFPVTATTTYGPRQKLNNRFSVAVAVDPVTEYVYVSEVCSLETCNKRIGVYDESGEPVGEIGVEGPGAFEGVPAGLGVSAESQKVYAAIEGDGSALSQVSVFESYSFFVGAPTILGASVTDITSSSAMLRARINPNTLDTTYWFEYGFAPCDAEPEACAKVPTDPASIGEGHQPVQVAVPLSGLVPGAKYYFRLVAENEDGVEMTSTRSFITQIGDLSAGLSDGRVWEQVTSPAKFGGVPTNAGLLQADPEGEGLAFQSRGSLVEDPEGNRALEPSAVLARRGESRWSVSDLVPRHTEAGGLGFGPEFKLFSPDLGQALLEPRDDTPLSPEASERAPYLRTNTSPPSYRPLVTSREGFANVPPGTVFGGEASGARNPVSISGSDDLLTHVVLSSEAPLVAGAAKRSLYLWSDGAIEPVSELPPGEGGGIVGGQVGSGAVSVRNSVSEDGSRVFWARGYSEPIGLDWQALYLRDTVAEETFRLDIPEPGASGAGLERPAFMAASADGSVVFFTDSQQLTEDSSPGGRDLYRCEIGDVGGGALGCIELEDLTAPQEGSGEDGESQEVALGMSEDGSAIYFVAGAILDDQPNESGAKAAAGGPNLYLWLEGQGVRFIALLSPEDRSDWGEIANLPVGHEPRVAANSSPSGRYLTFMSERNLTPAESDDPSTGQPVEQAFLYDAMDDSLLCVSCNFNGGTDPGHDIVKDEAEGGVIFPDPQGLWSGRRVGATLAEASEGEPTIGFALYRPRGVLDNGRVFFNSTSPLVTGDSNGTWDAYQYEPFGLGTCSPSAGTGTVVAGEDGCVGLISSGTDGLPSVFMDASTSGDDIFFATFARLSVLDTDDNVDVYDARVDGVEAVAELPLAECIGEACQPNGSQPVDPALNSATFNGRGNLMDKKPPKRCKKGQRKVKQGGKTKCVKAKKKRKHNRGKGGA